MNSLFSHLDDALKMRPTRSIAKGPLTLPNLCRIQSGAIAFYYQQPSGKILVDIVKAGEYTGLLLSPLPMKVQAVALEKVTLVEWQDQGVPLNWLMPFFRSKYAATLKHLGGSLRVPVSQRVVEGYLWLSERVGEPQSDGWVHLPGYVTHGLVAERIGTGEKVLTRQWSKLKKRGVVASKMFSRKYRVNPAGLRGLIGGEERRAA